LAMAPLASAAEAGALLIAGAVPTAPGDAGSLTSSFGVERLRSRVALWWQRLGQPADALAAAVAVSPACGLASASPAYARAALAACVEVARQLASDAGPSPTG